MAKAFLFIFLGMLPSYLLSENLEGGFGTIVNDQNEPISFSSDSLFFNEKTGTSELKGSVNINTARQVYHLITQKFHLI